jgi:undecaprenyl-diphosphatase
MSIPAILGANLLSPLDVIGEGVKWSEVPLYLVGVAVAAVSGYACLRLLKMIAEKGRFGWFSYYCWGIGLLTMLLTLVLG